MTKKGYRKLNHIHMVGIGGTGMNGIAEVLLNLGYKVSGSDLQENEATAAAGPPGRRDLDRSPGRERRDADVVVISSAVREDNVEVQRGPGPAHPRHPPGGDAGRAHADEVRRRRGRLPRQDDDDLDDGPRPRGRRVRPDDHRRRPPEHDRRQRQARRGRFHRGRGRRERPLLPLPLPFHRRPDEHRRGAPRPVPEPGGHQEDLRQLRQQGPLLLPGHPLPRRPQPPEHHPRPRAPASSPTDSPPSRTSPPGTTSFDGLPEPGRRSSTRAGPRPPPPPGPRHAQHPQRHGRDRRRPRPRHPAGDDPRRPGRLYGDGPALRAPQDRPRHHGHRGLRPPPDRDQGHSRGGQARLSTAGSWPSSSPTATRGCRSS